MLQTIVLAALAMPTEILANDDNFVTVAASQFRFQETLDDMDCLRIKVKTKTPFSEVVPSWSAMTRPGTKIEILIKPNIPGARTYNLGTWSQTERTSLKGQKDEIADVQTDILVLSQPITEMTVEVKLHRSPTGARPFFQNLNLVMTNPTVKRESREPLKDVWGKVIEVEKRAQMNYENGNVLCSPTSVSMLLHYWSRQTHVWSIDADVPDVQAAVHDPAWGGTGNWPFNMAFVNTRPLMVGIVSRFRDVRDLEEWIKVGVPIATSVSYGLLKGKEAPEPNDGHIVVLVGFDEEGNPVFNDPGRGVVRTTYTRQAFERAWATSGNTVYLTYPYKWQRPAMAGPWPSR
ncbi:MAG: C39 family peptidase [Fimbriimonadaceae bacterium]|jgi:uncharacterized protein YvpB|nr:C39 family peptidase [Fimbriimonadaceae bacterium]